MQRDDSRDVVRGDCGYNVRQWIPCRHMFLTCQEADEGLARSRMMTATQAQRTDAAA